MTSRTARIAIVISSFLAGLMLMFSVILFMTGRGVVPNIQEAAAIGGPFKLIDQDGKPLTDQDMKGKPFLVFFGFTHCPEVCPTKLFEISEILRKLGPDADKISALFITVDPERDTPALMKDYLSNFDPHLRGATGDAEAIAKVAKAYRVYYAKVPLEGGDYTMDHSAIVYLMDKNGHFVAPFNVKRTPDVAAADLRKYL